MSENIKERLAELESLVNQQQETIHGQRVQIARLSAAQSPDGSPSLVADGGDIKVVGEIDAVDGTGVLGRATGSGVTYGVRGEATSDDGYGLATPDDVKVDGVIETGGITGQITDNQALTNIAGNNLAIDESGRLNAQSGSGGAFESKAGGPAGDTWTQRTTFPTTRAGASAAAVNGNIYAIGGYTLNGSGGATSTDTVEVYNPDTDSWSEAAPLTSFEGAASAASLNGIIYAMSKEDATVEKYNPGTDSWSKVASPNTSRESAAFAALDGKVYLIGGYVNGVPPTDSVEAYDPASDSWTEVASLPQTAYAYNSHAGATSEKIYVLGGLVEFANKGNESLDQAITYDPDTDSWTTLPDLQMSRDNVGVTAVNDNVFAIGGSSETDRIEIYDPSRDMWWDGPAIDAESATSAGGTVYALFDGSRTSEGGVKELAGDPYGGAFTAAGSGLLAIHGDDDALVRNLTTDQQRDGTQTLVVEQGDEIEWIGSADATMYGVQ